MSNPQHQVHHLPLDERPSSSPTVCALLDYLQHHLEQYPFDLTLDKTFVQELVSDYSDLDLLEEIKHFRWYYDNRPPLSRQPRATIRRWIARAARFRREPWD